MTITEYRWNYHKTYARNGEWSRSYQNGMQRSIVNYAELTDNANSRVGTPGKTGAPGIYRTFGKEKVGENPKCVGEKNTAD